MSKTRGGKRGVSLWVGVAFFWGVIAVLGVIAALCPPAVNVAGLTVRLPQASSVIGTAAGTLISVEDQLDAVENAMRLKADSAARSAREARADSVARTEDIFRSSAGSLRFPKGDFSYLFPVFRAMRGGEAVSVFHYGDSQIEGDRITHLVRDSLQALFGGKGPGVLPLWQPIPSRTVSQSLSDSVATFYAAGMMGRRASHNRYGALAQMAELRGQDVTLSVEGRGRGGYRQVTAFVGNVEDTLTMSIDALVRMVPPSDGLRVVKWQLPSCSAFRLRLCGRADVYGVDVSAGRGVSVTNVPMRGADGLFLGRADATLMAAMMRSLNTRLVLMEFGGNALPMLSDSAGVERYSAAIGQQIDKMKAICPAARIIFIGPADMSVKVDGELQTHPMLPYLTEALEAVCDTRGVAFWDMYDVMGGRNSMLAWVEHQPPLAGTDYVHFTTRGANKIAEVLWRAIRMSYDYMLMVGRQKADNQNND